MNALRKTTIAACTAITLAAAGTMATPNDAQAGGFGEAAVAGFVTGAFIGAAAAHAAPGYYPHVYHQQCFWQTQYAGQDYYGRPVYQKVKFCQ